MTRRILSIQHGDYREAMAIVRSGQPEPYYGMGYTLRVLGEFFRADPHLIVSLDSPDYDEQHGPGRWAGVATSPRLAKVSRRLDEALRTRRVMKLIRQFRPTHLLLRTGLPIMSRAVLRLAQAQNLDTLVVLAGILGQSSPAEAERNRQYTGLLNQPYVFRVGNHKREATQSLVEGGLDPRKAVAWDWPGQRRAEDYPVKDRPEGAWSLVYAGSIIEAKGVGDLIDAAAILHRDGLPFRLEILGSGTDQPLMEKKAQALPDGVVRFHGRVPNAAVFEQMLSAGLVCVPSRPEFPEGMPLTLTEALASRTPVVAANHPVIVRAFQDGEGLKFCRSGDPADLARVARSIIHDPAEYRRLSATTAAALDRVNCSTDFGDLLDEWDRHPLAERVGHGA